MLGNRLPVTGVGPQTLAACFGKVGNDVVSDPTQSGGIPCKCSEHAMLNSTCIMHFMHSIMPPHAYWQV